MRSLFAALVLILLYFLLFPYPLGLELVARPRWAVSIPPMVDLSASGQPAAVPFLLGNRFGFVSPDGSLRYVGTVRHRVALSPAGFINFTRLGGDWILQDPGGRAVASFSGSGYPMLGPDGRRIFNVKSDLSGIIELDGSGAMLWERDVPTIITTASIQAELALFGLLNGSLLVLDRRGSPVFEAAPAGSRVPIALGGALAPNGRWLAAVCGIDPQFLLLYRRRGAGFEPLARLRLASTFRREVRLGFSPDSRLLYLEGPEGGGVCEASGGRLRWTPLVGVMAGAAFPAAGRAVAFLSRQPGAAQVVIEPLGGAPVCREEFPARETSLAGVDGQLLLGLDGALLRIDVEGR